MRGDRRRDAAVALGETADVRRPCYNFGSPERVYVEADPVISSAGGLIVSEIRIPRISIILGL